MLSLRQNMSLFPKSVCVSFFLALALTHWRLLFGGDFTTEFSTKNKGFKLHVTVIRSIVPPLTANACYQLGDSSQSLSCQWFEIFFQFGHSVSLSLKDLVFLVSAKSELADRQALWQVLVTGLAGATCHSAWLWVRFFLSFSCSILLYIFFLFNSMFEF